MAPTLDYVEGFEHQTVSTDRFASTNAVGIFDILAQPTDITISAGRNSGSALHVACLGTSATNAVKYLPATQTRVYSFYIKASAAPASDSNISSFFTSAGTLLGSIALKSSTGLIRARAGSSGSFTDGPAVCNGAWHLVDVYLNTVGTTWTLEWYVDEVLQTTNSLAAQTALTDQVRWLFGSATAANNATVDFDDCIASATAADFPILRHKVLSLRPTGDTNPQAQVGTNTMEDESGNDIHATNFPAWSRLDDWPANITDYVKQSTIGASNYAEVTFADTTEGVVWGVSGTMAGFGSNTGTNSATTRIVDSAGTTLTDIFAGSQAQLTAHYRQAVITPPSGGWTTAGLNGVKGRVGFSTDVTPFPYWTSLMLQYASPEAYITQPEVLGFGLTTPAGNSLYRETASISVAANRWILFCAQGRSSGGNFTEEPPVLSGLALNWTYLVRGHENGRWPRESWMWCAFTGPTPPATSVIRYTTNTTLSPSGSQSYAVLQFAAGELDMTDPFPQPRGRYPDWPPDNGDYSNEIHQEMATVADPRNAIAHYAYIGGFQTSTAVHDSPGFIRLGFYSSGDFSSGATGYGEWKGSEALLVNPTWPAVDGGDAQHYVSVAAEVRAAGTDNSIGRVRDRSLQYGVLGAGTVYTTGSFVTYRDRDVWLAVTSDRVGATPSQPTITSTLGWTWTLVTSAGYDTIASPTQKLWLFRTRIGTTDPGTNTITITYPESQAGCGWQVSETAVTSASPVVQTKLAQVDTGGASGFTATFDTPAQDTSGVLFFLAKADSNQALGVRQWTGTPAAGWVPHAQTPILSATQISIAGFGRHTPVDAASINLYRNTNAAMIAVEVAFGGGTNLAADLIDAQPQIFTPARVSRNITVGLIDVTPTIYTPQPSTTSFAQTVRLSTGAFQRNAFDDVAFHYGTSVQVDVSPTLYAPTTGTVSGQFVYVPAPGDTIAAFQQNAFDDETFQMYAAGEGISHVPSLLAPDSVSATVAAEQFVYLTGTGGWDSTLFVWDDPNHVWDEGNIGGLIQQSPQLFAPTVKETVTVPLLDATPTLYTHTVAPKSIVVPLINHPPALFDQRVNMSVYQADIIDVPVVLFGFFIQAPVEPSLIDHTPELFTPTVNPKQVEPGLILHEPALFDHKVNMSVLPGLLDATPLMYAPFVGPFINPIEIIDVTPVVYTPSLERIFMDLIDIGVELFEPQKVNIPVNTVVNFEFITIAEHEPELFEPVSIELSAPQFVIGQFIDGTPLVMGPHVITPTRPTIILRARYDPVTVLKARYDPVSTKHAQNARQGA